MSNSHMPIIEKIEHVVGILFLLGLAFHAGVSQSRIAQLELECRRHSAYIQTEQESLPVLAEQVRALGDRMAKMETTLAAAIRGR